jgi:broad specificity phosphatase PhoE
VVTLGRIIYASHMVDAIDPARLDRLPADVRAAFEAQAKALAETSGALDQERSARRRFELETSQLVAEKSNLAAENAFLKEANLRLEHLVHELRRARFGPRSEKLNPDQQQRSRSQKSRSPSDADPGRPMRPMSDVRNAVPAPCPKSCRTSSG